MLFINVTEKTFSTLRIAKSLSQMLVCVIEDAKLVIDLHANDCQIFFKVCADMKIDVVKRVSIFKNDQNIQTPDGVFIGDSKYTNTENVDFERVKEDLNNKQIKKITGIEEQKDDETSKKGDEDDISSSDDDTGSFA